MSLSDMVTLKDYGKFHELGEAESRKLRRLVRNAHKSGEGPLADKVVKFGNTFGIDINTPLPDLATTARVASRADGRKRFIVFMTNAEAAAWAAEHGADTVIDVRERARARRAAKAAAKADADG